MQHRQAIAVSAAAVHPWQLLDADLHLHTLNPEYAPVGLLEMVNPVPRRVLDVGCFCGGSGRWLKKRFPGCQVIGVEMLEKAAALAAQAYDRVVVGAFEKVDFAAQGLAPGGIDAIVAADVLEHLHNPWQAPQRLNPLLAPDGALYVSLPDGRNLGVLFAPVRGEWRYTGAGIFGVTHLRFFTRARAEQMLGQTGWAVSETRLNPDPDLASVFKGKDIGETSSINAGKLKLEGLARDEVLELLVLQIFFRAVPVFDR